MKSDIDVWYWSLSVEFLPDSKRQEARGQHFDSLKRGLTRDRIFFSISSKSLGCLQGNCYSL